MLRTGLSGGRVVVDARGRVVLCDDCPCYGDTGTGTDPPAYTWCGCESAVPNVLTCVTSGADCSCLADGRVFNLYNGNAGADVVLPPAWASDWFGGVYETTCTFTADETFIDAERCTGTVDCYNDFDVLITMCCVGPGEWNMRIVGYSFYTWPPGCFFLPNRIGRWAIEATAYLADPPNSCSPFFARFENFVNSPTAFGGDPTPTCPDYSYLVVEVMA